MEKVNGIFIVLLICLASCTSPDNERLTDGAQKSVKSLQVNQRDFVLTSFCQMFSYWEALLEQKDKEAIKNMSMTVAAIDLNMLADPKGQSLFKQVKKQLQGTRTETGYDQGWGLGESSKTFGDIILYYDITNEEVTNKGHVGMIKRMDGLRKLMRLVGQR